MHYPQDTQATTGSNDQITRRFRTQATATTDPHTTVGETTSHDTATGNIFDELAMLESKFAAASESPLDSQTIRPADLKRYIKMNGMARQCLSWKLVAETQKCETLENDLTTTREEIKDLESKHAQLGAKVMAQEVSLQEKDSTLSKLAESYHILVEEHRRASPCRQHSTDPLRYSVAALMSMATTMTVSEMEEVDHALSGALTRGREMHPALCEVLRNFDKGTTIEVRVKGQRKTFRRERSPSEERLRPPGDHTSGTSLRSMPSIGKTRLARTKDEV